jgi:carbamoyltransferase
LTGGVSLNIVANSYYRENLDSDINLYVDPLCGDEGNSIGVGQLYCYDHCGFLPTIDEKIYLCGNNPSYDFELENGEEVFENVEYSSVVDLLIEGNIISIFQGKSEAGPRALGNRSILFDPRVKDGKDIVNRVKRREPFRPFACSILLEESHKWFDMTHIKESPHMMYSFKALPGVKDIIPSVIHVDNTSRIQTVTQEQNFHYYNLIKEFFVKTNVPVLFNTSFNLAGETIVENISDALSTLRRSELEYLYLPEIGKLIYIKNREK